MSIATLMSDREKLETAAKAIDAAIHDMQAARADAQFNSGCAAAWAAVMMTCDIVRAGLSSAFRVADREFQAIDKGIALANHFLSFWGHTPIATKADLMATVDPEFRRTEDLLESVQAARQFLKKHRINPPPHAARQVNLILDLGVAMTEDTLLLMQAGNTGTRAAALADQGISAAQHRLRSIRTRINRINHQIMHELEMRERFATTA